MLKVFRSLAVGVVLVANGGDRPPPVAHALWQHAHLEEAAGALRAAPNTAASGVLQFLTYNVAGLPELMSPSSPSTNIPRMSGLLNSYDIVVVQEDFSYHSELVHDARHAYRVGPKPSHATTLFGDGLSALSVFPFGAVERVRWATCNGYIGDDCDCFGEKGFARFQIELAQGAKVFVYNLHADAGNSEADRMTRQRQFAQLAEHIERHAKTSAIIVAGDTNLALSNPRDEQTLQRFIAATGLTDACQSLNCGREELDRVLVRPSPELRLSATHWQADARFVDDGGKKLSDHSAIYVEVAWELSEKLQARRLGPDSSQPSTPTTLVQTSAQPAK